MPHSTSKRSRMSGDSKSKRSRRSGDSKSKRSRLSRDIMPIRPRKIINFNMVIEPRSPPIATKSRSTFTPLKIS